MALSNLQCPLHLSSCQAARDEELLHLKEQVRAYEEMHLDIMDAVGTALWVLRQEAVPPRVVDTVGVVLLRSLHPLPESK